MRPPPTDRRARWITLILAALILIPSMLGFGAKFIELVAVLRGNPEGAFAVAPIANYLLASAGFLLLFLWAALNGMFRDIEGPKYTMLEQQRELDRQEPASSILLFRRSRHE
jgi:hypothetical protein